MKEGIKKVVRFVKIYGVFRTLTKVIGRIRPRFKFWWILKFPLYLTNGKKIGLVGCGHHAFSSIAYYLTTSTNCNIVFALDIDNKASSSLSYAYNAVNMGCKYDPDKVKKMTPDLVYISSNHASHVQYAVQFLEYGCDVFIEKPIAINSEQLDILTTAVKKSNRNIYTGYNRPHSPAWKIIKGHYIDDQKPFTLSCFVSGHFIPEDHWYRDKLEGTRIVSNLGHWLDLSIYVLSWSKILPEYLDITVTYSDVSMPSDNIAIAMTSPNSDLINITFTSRGEPFEGVSEMINFQKDDFNAQIEDYRVTKIWKDSIYKKYRHWPKNNGHKASVLQPFGSVLKRTWPEIQLSTRLMLCIEEMVVLNLTNKRFDL